MATPPELEQEIERTREELSRTVDELAAKADVKARAREMAAQAREKARERAVVARDKAVRALGKSRERAVELSGQVRRSQVARRGWPFAAAVGALVIGSAAAWRRSAVSRGKRRKSR
jgi:CHASE3 domain sensor protein